MDVSLGLWEPIRRFFLNVNFDLILLTYLQENVCNQKDKSCVESIKINKIHENKCLVQCSGLLVSGFTKSKGNENFKDLFPVEFQKYNKYKYAFALRSAFKGRYYSQLCMYLYICMLILFKSLWMGEQVEICEDLFWHSNVWQNFERQFCQVCRHVVSYWRNNGTIDWILHYKCSGNNLLCCQDTTFYFQ